VGFGEPVEVMFEEGVAVGRERHAVEGDGIGAGGGFPEIGKAVLVGIEWGRAAIEDAVAGVSQSRLNLVCIQFAVRAAIASSGGVGGETERAGESGGGGGRKGAGKGNDEKEKENFEL